MRQHSLDQGFTLNEYCIRPLGATGKILNIEQIYLARCDMMPPTLTFDLHMHAGVPGEPIPVSSEEDIFDIIEMAYKNPEERNL